MPDSEGTPQDHPELASDNCSRPCRWNKQAELQEGEGDMNNQHAGLSQALAEQRITQRREQAVHARLAGGARPPRRRRRWAGGGWWQLARWPAVATEQPAGRPQRAS
jgi:hypothetical protein